MANTGLRIEFLHGFPMSEHWNWAPFTKQDEQGHWRIEGGLAPLVFSLKATSRGDTASSPPGPAEAPRGRP